MQQKCALTIIQKRYNVNVKLSPSTIHGGNRCSRPRPPRNGRHCDEGTLDAQSEIGPPDGRIMGCNRTASELKQCFQDRAKVNGAARGCSDLSATRRRRSTRHGSRRLTLSNRSRPRMPTAQPNRSLNARRPTPPPLSHSAAAAPPPRSRPALPSPRARLAACARCVQ